MNESTTKLAGVLHPPAPSASPLSQPFSLVRRLPASEELDMNFSGEYNDTDDDSNDLVEPQYFSYRYRFVGTFFISIVFIVGVLGNAMVVLVVTRVRSLHSPTNCYLLSLAVADTVVLFAAVPQEILSYYLVGNQWIWGDIGCALFIFSQNLGINASSLSLVAFTVERYIAICHPMKAHKICTRGHAERVTLVVWCFATLYCSPWLGLTKTQTLNYRGYSGIKECTMRLPRKSYLMYYFTDLVMFYVVPLILSCIFYTLISLALISRPVVSTKNANNIYLDSSSSSMQSKTKVRNITIEIQFP